MEMEEKIPSFYNLISKEYHPKIKEYQLPTELLHKEDK
jgi:hypothetical protein